MSVAAVIAQSLLLVTLAPPLDDLGDRIAGIPVGRRCLVIGQGYRDLWKALRKETLRSTLSVGFAAVAPAVALLSTLLAGLLLPSAAVAAPLGGAGDPFVAVFLLLLGRLAFSLAQDPAGEQRGTWARNTPIEPVLVLVIVVALAQTGTTAALRVTAVGMGLPGPGTVLAMVAVALAALADRNGMPPSRLASGRDLALLSLASALRRLVIAGLAAALFLPWGLQAGPALGLLAYLLKMLALTAGLAALRRLLAQWRLRSGDLLFGAAAFAILALAAQSALQG